MNKFFRIIWSKTLQGVIVVPEVGPACTSGGRRTRKSTEQAVDAARTLGLAALTAMAGAASVVQAQQAATALPQNGQVAAGQATINTPAAGAMVIEQSTQRAVINWDRFDIGQDASVTFQQPSTSSVALNRVTNANPSQIFGQLRANGQVFLTNSQGIYFAPGARVDVGGLVATSHSITDDAFMSGAASFDRNDALGAVVNEGDLKAREKGYIALMAPEVRNLGIIRARLGTIALAAGEAINLEFSENGSLINLRVTPAQIDTLIENRHLIQVPGGQVIISAQAAGDLRSGIIRNEGTIEAQAINEIGGRIFLGGTRIESTTGSKITGSAAPATSLRPVLRPSDAQVHISAGQIVLAGEITSTGDTGGTVAIEGQTIALTSDAVIDASGTRGGGNVLIGGDWQGGANPDRRVFASETAMTQATAVTMETGALIDASARHDGDGGTVVLWSDINNQASVTDVGGTIFARGGTHGGHGGQIETSGALLFTNRARGSAGAPRGKGGEWLFDPYNITIIGTGSDSNGSFGSGTWTPSGNDSKILASSITALLDAGTNVTVATGGTGSAGSQNGDITLSAALTATGNAGLTLSAAGDVTLNAAIDIAGPLSVTGDSITANDTLGISGDLTLTAQGVDVMLNKAVTNAATSTSTMTVKAARHVRLGTDASITAAAEMNTQLWADTDADGDGINFVESSGITTVGGDLTFGKNGQTATIGGNTVLVGGDLFMQRTSAQTLSTSGGAINIYGETMVANTSGLTISSGNGDVTFHGLLNSSNQYTWVDKTGSAGTGSWDAARTEAKNGTAGGASTGDSYLVNITSRLENSVAGLTAGYRGAWIGAYRSDSNAYTWSWADGPESGDHFFTQSGSGSGNGGGSATSGYYSNFGTGEPNGSLSGTRSSVESVGQFFGTAGQWNDLRHTGTYSATQSSPYAVLGFVRETNLASSPVTVNAGTGTATFAGTVGTAKPVADFSVTAGAAQINGGAVSSTGAQTYSAPVTIGADTVFTAQDNDIVFNSTLDSASGGNYDVTTTITPGTTYYWADWTSKTSTTVSGTITIGSETINITYTNNSGRTNSDGNAYYGVQTSGGTNYWGHSGGSSPYLSDQVANAPSTSEIIQLQFAGSQTLTFSKPVENLAFAVVSLNARSGSNNGYAYDQDFDILSYSGYNGAGSGHYGTGGLTKSVSDGLYKLQGVSGEPHGTIRFNKAFSQLTWNSLNDETWNGFSVGITGSSESAGEVRFNGAIGGANALGDLSVNGGLKTSTSTPLAAGSLAVTGLASLGADVTTSGNQTYGSAVTLTGNTRLRTTSAGTITTNATGNIDGAHDLTIETTGTGTVNIGAAIGANTAVSGLTVASAGTAAIEAVSTSGPVSITATGLTLNGDLNTSAGNGDLALNASSAITLPALTSLSTGSGDVSLTTPKISGANFSGSGKVSVTSTGALTIAAGGTSFDGNFLAGSLSSVGGQFDLLGTLAGDTFTGSSETAWLVVNSVSNLSGLTIGNSGLTNAIGIGGAWTINGPITITGGTVNLSDTLTATNSSTGDITIGTSGLTGSGAIAIATGRALNITQSGDSTYSGVISGSNSTLNKSGAGTLTLGANNTYTGATMISAGKLKIGTGGATGSLATSGVTNNGTLQYHLGQDSTISYDISGTGSVDIIGGETALFGDADPTNNLGFLTASAQTVATNTTVLEVLERLSGARMNGQSVNGAPGTNDYSLESGVYFKTYDPATDTATFQTQIFFDYQSDGIVASDWTKVVFVKLSQSGNDVQAQVYQGRGTSYGVYAAGDKRGSDFTTLSGVSSMGLATAPTDSGYGVDRLFISSKASLTGTNTYSGGTTLSQTSYDSSSVKNGNTSYYSRSASGILQIGDGGSAGTINSASITNNGLVIFDRSDDLTVATDFTGAGNIIKKGSNTLSYTGAGNHTGTTYVYDGTLSIGAGGTAGSLSGDINNKSALTFNRSDTATYGGVISGNGSITQAGGGDLILTADQTYSGVTNINAGRLVLQNDTPQNGSSGFAGAGTLVIQPASSDFSSAFSTSGWSFGTTLGGLVIGKSATGADGTSDAAVTINSAISVNGPIDIYGSAIGINSAIAATDGGSPATLSDINLHASGAVTQSAAITADGLGLHGTGSFTLTNSANSVTTIAGGNNTTKLGAVSFVNGTALTVGTVNPTGITATGDVSIATASGDLTVSQNISTDSTSASAITLTAASAQTAGTASGGDVLLSGALTTGTNGRIRMFTGSITGSTGVATKVGSGSGNFRYNADETTDFTSGSWASLGNSGSYGIYREQPSATISDMTLSMTYGDTLPSITATGAVNGDGSAYSITGASYSSSNNLKASGTPYTVTSSLVGFGYNVSGVSSGTLSVGTKGLAITGAGASDKVYDATTSASVTGGGITTISGDSVALSAANASFASSDVGTGIAISTSYSLSGADAGNYSLAQPGGLSADITAKTVTLSATRSYDGTLDLTGDVTIGGLAGSQTLGYSGATTNDKHAATTGKYINAITLTDGTGSNPGTASNYQLPDLTQATTGVNTVTINPLVLTASLVNSSITKVYDGTANAPSGFAPQYTFSGLIGDDAAALVATSAAYNSANVSAATTLTVGGLAIDGITGSLGSRPTDYTLAATSLSKSATIAKAPLTITANDDAKFVTQSDTSGFKGVSYAGFVNGENDTALGGTLSIARSNSGVNLADTYADVLIPANLTSSNYDITFVPGDYTIVPSDQLLVRMTDIGNTYGTATQYVIDSVEYHDGTNVIRLNNNSVPASSASINGSNRVTINDGAGGTAAFTIGPKSARLSGAGQLVVGGYQLGTSGTVTENSSNFGDIVTVTGAHQVNTKSLTASASNVRKTYDGTSDVTAMDLGLTGKETNDSVTVSGMGSFGGKSVGTGLNYTIYNLALAGEDAANYHLSGSTSLSGTNGEITRRTLAITYSGTDKIYDGSMAATISATDDRINGDAVTLTQTAAFADKNVGSAKTINITGITLSGADAGNYSVATTATTSASITRLNSVSWIGGATGNWFDPANWAGGAVPDLANVADVTIPSGVTVSFDTSQAVSPADASQAVSIDSLGSSGNLTQRNGTLNVGGGGVTLSNLTQNGGSLTNAGATQLTRFTQTGGTFGGTGNFAATQLTQSGGTTTLQGNLTVTDGFGQGTSGTITVSGDTAITDTNGGMTIGNLDTTGSTALISRNGAIAQAIGTAIRSVGMASVTASDGATPANTFDVTLSNAGNDFGSALTVSGANVALTDTDALQVTVTATGTATLTAGGTLSANLDTDGNSTLNSAGNMTVAGNTQMLTTTTTGSGSTTTFGATVIRGNLSVTGTGDVGQTAAMTINGTSNFSTAGHDVTLSNTGNNFTGAISGAAASMTIGDSSALTLGTISTTGNLTLQSNGALDLGVTNVAGNLTASSGNSAISQSGAATVAGLTVLSAGSGDIALMNTANSFGTGLSATANNISLMSNGVLRLNNIAAAGALAATASDDLILAGLVSADRATLTATNGDIQQTDGRLVISTGPNTLTAADTITLTLPGNSITGDLTVTAQTSEILTMGTMDNALSAAAAAITAGTRRTTLDPVRSAPKFTFRDKAEGGNRPALADQLQAAQSTSGGLAIRSSGCDSSEGQDQQESEGTAESCGGTSLQAAN